MMTTIPIEIALDSEIYELQMDVLYRLSDCGTPQIRACFLEEIPSPSSHQQYFMQAKAEEFLSKALERK